MKSPLIYQLKGDSNKYPGFVQVYADGKHNELWKQGIGRRSAASAGKSMRQEYELVMLEFNNAGRKKNLVADLSLRMAPFIILSECAYIVLKDILDTRGELLPVQAPVSGYTGYHMLRSIGDSIDLDKSIYTRYDSGNIMLRKPVFFAHKVQDEPIFVIPEAPTSIYVSDQFKRQVEANALTGFDFSNTVDTV